MFGGITQRQSYKFHPDHSYEFQRKAVSDNNLDRGSSRHRGRWELSYELGQMTLHIGDPKIWVQAAKIPAPTEEKPVLYFKMFEGKQYR